MPTKAFNLRLVAEDVSDRLTGFLHNAVTPVGIATPDMPIILSHRSLNKLLHLEMLQLLLYSAEAQVHMSVHGDTFK